MTVTTTPPTTNGDQGGTPPATPAAPPAGAAPATPPAAPPAAGTGGAAATTATRLPNDHPLVTAYERVKEEAGARQTRITELEAANEQHTQQVEALQAQLATADAAVDAVPATVAQHLRDHLVRVHQISDTDRDLLLTATDPDTLLRQVARLVERQQQRTGVVPTQGTGDPGARVGGYAAGEERARARYGQQQQ